MIQDFKDKHKGETAVIVGNGPSLENAPLYDLGAKYVTFGANKIYDYPYDTTYWACADNIMLTECIPWVMKSTTFKPEKFVPRDIPLPGAHQMNLKVEIGFSLDAAKVIYFGGTISFINMQLAKYMGFDRLLLIGMDHRYTKAQEGGRPGSKFIATGEDPDHFKTKGGFMPYFQPGRIYNRPELDATEKFFYPLAKRAFAGGIINLTENSALTVFQKEAAEKWI